MAKAVERASCREAVNSRDEDARVVEWEAAKKRCDAAMENVVQIVLGEPLSDGAPFYALSDWWIERTPKGMEAMTCKTDGTRWARQASSCELNLWHQLLQCRKKFEDLMSKIGGEE